MALCSDSSSLPCTAMAQTTSILLSGFVPYIRFKEEVKKNSSLLQGQGVSLLEVNFAAIIWEEVDLIGLIVSESGLPPPR